MKEANIQNEIMVAVSKAGATIFRNNVGVGWAGKAQMQSSERMVKVYPGDVIVRQARPLHAGLCKGSSDLIGWDNKGGFLALEVKAEKGRASVEQNRFINAVRKAGGRAGIARSADDAVKIALDDGLG